MYIFLVLVCHQDGDEEEYTHAELVVYGKVHKLAVWKAIAEWEPEESICSGGKGLDGIPRAFEQVVLAAAFWQNLH